MDFQQPTTFHPSFHLLTTKNNIENKRRISHHAQLHATLLIDGCGIHTEK